MTSDQVRTLHQAKPFAAFTLNLADGEKIPVKSPEFMWITPGGRTVFVSQGDEKVSIIDLLLVTQLTLGNGRNSRRKA